MADRIWNQGPRVVRLGGSVDMRESVVFRAAKVEGLNGVLTVRTNGDHRLHNNTKVFLASDDGTGGTGFIDIFAWGAVTIVDNDEFRMPYSGPNSTAPEFGKFYVCMPNRFSPMCLHRDA